MLLVRGKNAEALTAFETVLAKEPNRFRAIAGAARAAQDAGDMAKAKAHYEALLAMCKEADTERPELKLDRTLVGG